MAMLPPRKNPTPTKISRQHITPLQTLLQMGFPSNRAEKALCATGHRGVQLASDWLLAHVNDPTLDTDSVREYVVYLCPGGSLLDQIHAFWEDSLNSCGWNGAHNLLPHITLCSFFKCENESCESLISTLERLVLNAQPSLPKTLLLEKYISQNYMGLFIGDEQADSLKHLATQFAKAVGHVAAAPAGDASRKDLHLTLAYQFPASHFTRLEALVGHIDPWSAGTWEVRLYSRDPTTTGCEVYRVQYSHVPQVSDELELLIGDFVYINGDNVSTSPDGWVEGKSWLTGCTGFLPVNYVERTSESDAWTLHRAITIIGSNMSQHSVPPIHPPTISLSLLNLLENSEGSRRSMESSSDQGIHELGIGSDEPDAQLPSVPLNMDALYAKVKKPKNMSLYKFPIEGPRKVIVARHGERVDFTFGDWTRFCFDEAGLGIAELMPIKVEPGLFEWLAWYPDGMPVWMSPQEMIAAGFNIDIKYIPLLAVNELTDTHENCESFYVRNACVTQSLIDNTEAQGGTILLVGHAATIDTCTRQLVGEEPRSAHDMTSLIRKVPYGCTAMMSQDYQGHWALCAPPVNPVTYSGIMVPYCSVGVAVQDPMGGSWSVVEPPFPPVTHSANIRYDWKLFS